MKPVAAMVAITVLVGVLAGGPLLGTGPVAAAATPTAGPMRLELDQLSPRMVTADGPRELTVSGLLTNTGDRPVDQLVVRVQRGDPLRSEGELRDALEGGGPTDAVTPQFTALADELPPGGQLPVRLTVPLRGAPQSSLALARAGVYELLVNVNGVQRDGGRARLAAVRVLLPVRSLPPDPSAGAAGTGGGAASPSASTFTLLYPVADTPRRLSTVPGEPVLLRDDDLAASLAPGGRLSGLVTAFATRAPAGSRLRAASCLALDPDLVETAAAMRGGYQVRTPDGGAAPGAGAAAAASWLDALGAAARGGCVLALPYADADLVALSRAGLAGMATASISDGRTILAATLGTPVLPGVTWPADGLADEATRDAAGAADGRVLVLAADGLDQGRSPRNAGVLAVRGGPVQQFAVLTDPLLATAAAGPAADPTAEPVPGGAAAPTSPAGTAGPLSTQDVIGTLVYRVQSPAGGGPLVLAPPHQWAAGGAAAAALLDVAAALIDEGRLVAQGLDVVTRTGVPTAGEAPLRYPLRSDAGEIPAAVLAGIRATAADLDDLSSAAVDGNGLGITPAAVFAPLRQGLVRPASVAWRGRQASAEAAGEASARRISDLRASVRVLEPPSPYSLGTSDAPLLLTVGNGLPVTMRVRVELSSTSGLRVEPIPQLDVPALGRRQVQASAEVTRSGQFTVEAAVRTPDGGLLGPPSRLKARSTVYGTITGWLTGSAAVLLVVLAARRVLRRRGDQTRRTDPDRAGSPPPDPAGQAPAAVAGTPTGSPPVRTAPDGGPARPARPPGRQAPEPAASTERLPAVPPSRPPSPYPRPPGQPGPRLPSPRA